MSRSLSREMKPARITEFSILLTTQYHLLRTTHLKLPFIVISTVRTGEMTERSERNFFSALLEIRRDAHLRLL